MLDGRLLAEMGRHAGQLLAESSSDMLRRVRGKLSDDGRQAHGHGLGRDELGKRRELASRGRSDFRLIVFEKASECRNKLGEQCVAGYNASELKEELVTFYCKCCESRTHLSEMQPDHVSNAPRTILPGSSHRLEKILFDEFLAFCTCQLLERLCHCDQSFYGQQTDTVLFVCSELPVKRKKI